MTSDNQSMLELSTNITTNNHKTSKHMSTHSDTPFRKWFRSLMTISLAVLLIVLSGIETSVSQDTSEMDRDFLALMQSNQTTSSEENLVTMQFTNLTLAEALEKLAKELRVGFSYNPEIMLDKKITLQFVNMPAHEVLYTLLEGTGLEPILPPSRDVIVIREKEIEEKEELFQETVRGTVVDARTGETLPGVNILIEGTSSGTTTNVDGEFELSVPSLQETLIFSYIGYQRLVIDIGDRNEIHVEMLPDVQMLDDLVVVGYGSVQRRHLTGSVGNVQMDESLASRPIVNIGDALYGKVAGVQVLSSSGRPGESSRIQIRGVSSLSAGSEPLIVVDGIPLPSFDLNTLNASDIESIDILKDASSAAIYGSRAAGGVILVTTRSGSSDASSISFNYSFTTQDVLSRVDVMNTAEYAQASIDAAQIGWIRSGGDPNAPNTLEARGERKYTWPSILETPELLPNVDYQDAIYRTAPMHQAVLSASGGGENSRYYTSFGIVNQDGIIVNTGYEKYTLNLNVDTKISDFITVGGRVNSSYDIQTGSQAIHIRTANQYPPLYPVYTEEGYLGGPHNTPGFEPWNSILFRAHHGHPLQKIDEIDDREGFNIAGNVFANIDLLSGLAFRSSLNTFYSRNDRVYFEQANTNIGPDVRRQARMRSWMDRSLNYTWENLLFFNNNWEDHQVDIVAGYEYTKRDFYSMYGERRNYDNDLLPYLGAGNTIINATDNANESTLISVISRVNYNYLGRYMASLSFRRDGSSRFGPENKWGNFPAASIGWRVTDESFMQDFDYLNELTFRVSYGFTGNDNFGDYRWIRSLSQANVAFGNNLSTSYYPSNIENSDLRWERTRQLNFGLNLGLLENRIYLETDIYRSESDGLLLDVPVPSITGFSSEFRNIGSLENNGIEISLITRNFISSSSAWSSNFTFGRNRAIITSLGPDDAPLIQTISQMGIINQVGKAPFSFYGFDYLGAYRNQAEIDEHGVEYPFQVHPGMGKYRDVNGDGLINSDDRTIIGNAQPDFTWAFGNSFSYQNFDFSFLLHGSVGGDIFDSNWHRSMYYHEGRNYLTRANDRWRSEEEPGDGYIHALDVDVATGSFEREASSYWIMDGTYTRLKDVTIGYSLPVEYVTRLGITGARIYLNGTNLLTFQNTTTIDPENMDGSPTNPASVGVQHSQYPSARTFTIGFNLDF